MCDFINEHEDIITITTFGEYRVLKKVMSVIKEANNLERERRQTARKRKGYDAKVRIQRTNAVIAMIKQG